MCAYPELIAAYRDLLRLLMPRHSPCALYSLILFKLILAQSYAESDLCCFDFFCFELLSITFQLMTYFSTKLFLQFCFTFLEYMQFSKNN